MDGPKHDRMMIKVILKRETGFILPITLITIFFFSAFILYNISQLNMDRKFLEERKLLVKEVELKKMATHDIIDGIKTKDPSESSNELYYDIGTVHFRLKGTDENVLRVEASLSIPPEHQATFQFSYNIIENKIIKWVE